MLRKVPSQCAVFLLLAAMSGEVFAEEISGKITKVTNAGREITVKAKGGKEMTLKLSGSRTTIEGVKGRGDLKEGQNVMVEHEGDAAKKVKVTK